MSDRLRQLEVFVRAADLSNFSSAARELGMSQPSVSRTISNLEARLGVRLLLRSTRQIKLTEAGATLLERARQVLSDATDAEDAARGADALRGRLRVATPVGFAVRELIPLLPDFLERHPGLRVEFRMSDRPEDLIAEGVDVAFRFGPLNDSGFTARRLASVPRYTVAAPAYLRRRGTPKSPANLAKHDCISGPNAKGRASWTYRRKGAVFSVELEHRLDMPVGAGMIACAALGLGITIAPYLMARTELDSGALVKILRDFVLEPLELHAVFPGGSRLSGKARAFVDHVASRLPVRPG